MSFWLYLSKDRAELTSSYLLPYLEDFGFSFGFNRETVPAPKPSPSLSDLAYFFAAKQDIEMRDIPRQSVIEVHDI